MNQIKIHHLNTERTENLNVKEQTQGFSLKDKTAAVVGLGGLGCNIAVHLAGAGFKRIYLFDYDTVNESNLNRQFFYKKDDIGKSKTERAKAFLSAYAPETEFVGVGMKIEKARDLDCAKSCDIIFSALDNSEARLVLEGFCRKAHIPLVTGGIDGFYGMAYLYLPDESTPPEELGLSEKGKAKHNVSAAAGIIGSLQASIGIQYLLTNDKSISKKLFIYDETQLSTLKLK